MPSRPLVRSALVLALFTGGLASALPDLAAAQQQRVRSRVDVRLLVDQIAATSDREDKVSLTRELGGAVQMGQADFSQADERTVTVLMDLLSAEDDVFVSTAARTLGGIGPAAKRAAPLLRSAADAAQCRNDLRGLATIHAALTRIDGSDGAVISTGLAQHCIAIGRPLALDR